MEVKNLEKETHDVLLSGESNRPYVPPKNAAGTNCAIFNNSTYPSAIQKFLTHQGNKTQDMNSSKPAHSSTNLSNGTQCVKTCTKKSHSPSVLPPIGVFWDIENCRVPSGVSALSVVQMIRDNFFQGYKEEEFVVVCDVKKESVSIINDLNLAQLDLVHVSSTCKNAADEKLRQSLRRFGERHESPAAVILISGDVNFAPDLNDLKHKKKFNVILLHPPRISRALIMCSTQNHDYLQLCNVFTRSWLAIGGDHSVDPEQMDIEITNLPRDVLLCAVKRHLEYVGRNMGGRVVGIERGRAVMRFANKDTAYRATIRMQNENVFGYNIQLGPPQPAVVASRFDIPPRNLNPQLVPQMAGPSWCSAEAGTHQSNMWTKRRNNSFSNLPSQDLFSQRPQGMMGRHSSSGTVEQNFDSTSSAVMPWLNQATMSYIQALQPQANLFTPQPMMSQATPYTRSVPAKPSTGPPSEVFQPIQIPLNTNSVSCPVDLQVSNIDHSLDPKELRCVLLKLFKEHVPVLHLSVYTQSDGQLSARVRVPSRQDAQVAVAALQRYEIGSRRIRISIPTLSSRSGSVSPSNQIVKANVAALLKEVPSQTLPLYQLCDLFEKRFLFTVSLSELNRMRDVVNITDSSQGGRMISLVPESKRSSTPSFSDLAFTSLQDGQLPEMPYCPMHALGDTASVGWAEKTLQPLPNVRISLLSLSRGIYSLLTSHHGALPLHSFPLCYEAEIRPVPVDDNGVPLEHLVTWVKGVMLKCSPNGGCSKMLTWGTNIESGKPSSSSASDDGSDSVGSHGRCTSPAQLAAQVSLFGREVVELLRSSPRCQLLFVKFIPAYHHHFGRQCRVANYGYTRLLDLLEALPNVVQVIGESDMRIIVLAQAAQIRRFTSDLLRVLKAQPNKQAVLSELPDILSKGLNKPFDPVDYGLCDLNDLISRVPAHTVVLTPPFQEDCAIEPDTILALPKRDQTPEEMERMRIFAKEVVSLLRGAPQCSIPFNKFIPAYHHHYGHQCRLADYGMNRLTELLAAVSDVAQIEDVPGGDRRIVLSLPERQKVLGEQIRLLVMTMPKCSMLLSQLSCVYQRQFGVSLDPPMYGAATLFDLVSRLSASIRIIPSACGPLIQPSKLPQTHGPKIFSILRIAPNYCMPLQELFQVFQSKYNENVNLFDLQSLDHMVYINSKEVCLTLLYKGAAKIRTIIVEQGGTALLSSIFSLYIARWGQPLNPSEYGHTSLQALLSELPDVFSVSGRGKKRTISLKDNVSLQDEAAASNTTNVIPSTCSDAAPTGQEQKESNYVIWGPLLPGPSNVTPLPTMSMPIPTPAANSAWNKHNNSMPWIGQPWGLHGQNVNRENVWSESTPMKLWSPPKCMKTIVAPDACELPMPEANFLEQQPKDLAAEASGFFDIVPRHRDASDSTIETSPRNHSGTADFSDSGISGIGQVSPTSPPKRQNRLAALFSTPLEL